jgi:hypothetical protein
MKQPLSPHGLRYQVLNNPSQNNLEYDSTPTLEQFIKAMDKEYLKLYGRTTGLKVPRK